MSIILPDFYILIIRNLEVGLMAGFAGSMNRIALGILASVTALTLIQLAQPEHVSAQVLSQEVGRLLAGNCDGLGIGPAGSLAGLGDQLTTLCATPNTAGASSTGGGAASLQGSAASILNRALLQRLNETDEEECQEQGFKEKCQRQSRSSSLSLNPFGLLTTGFGNNLSVSSPLYASTTANGGSTGSFAASSSRWNGLGFFTTGLVESLNRNVTTFQDGYKSMIYGVTAGGDYRFNKKLVTGLAFNYSNTNGNFRTGGGDFNTNSYGGILYGSYLPTDRTFVQVTGGYTRNNYLISRLATVLVLDDPNFVGGTDRPGSGQASSNSTSNVFNVNALAGYDHPIGRFTVGPRVGVTYSNTKIGEYQENGSTGIELKYQDQWIHSLQSVVGIQASGAFSTGFGVLVPQINADYIHEFANSQRHIGVQFAQDFRVNPTKFQFQNEAPDRNYVYLGTGLLMVLPNGWQPFMNFRAMVANEHFQNYAGTLGLRIAL